MIIFQHGTLLLEEKEVVELIKTYKLDNFLLRLIDELERGFRDFYYHRIQVPKRLEFYYTQGSIECMPASDNTYFGCKIVGTYPNNITFKLPTILATGILLDGTTGYPLLLTESTILTALRTAAASAIATKYLASQNSSVVGIIGNGAQSIPQIHALSLIKNIKKVYAYDVDKEASISFKDTIERLLGIEVVITDPKKVSSNAEILITATCKEKNTPPVVYNDWVNDGTHINAIGGDAPGKVELEKSLVERSKLVVDFKEQAIYEGEAQQVSPDKVYADLAEVVANGIVRNDNDVTIFDSVGFALEDLVIYKIIYNLALEYNIGKRVKIAATPRYIKNLYRSYFL